MVVDPSGQFLYTTNAVSNNISGFLINPDTGMLVQSPASPFAAGTGPQALAIDASGSLAYAVNRDSYDLWVCLRAGFQNRRAHSFLEHRYGRGASRNRLTPLRLVCLGDSSAGALAVHYEEKLQSFSCSQLVTSSGAAETCN